MEELRFRRMDQTERANALPQSERSPSAEVIAHRPEQCSGAKRQDKVIGARMGDGWWWYPSIKCLRGEAE
jgi:hypothetical protein